MTPKVGKKFYPAGEQSGLVFVSSTTEGVKGGLLLNVPLVLLAVGGALVWTWWEFFRKRVTVCVAGKQRFFITKRYPAEGTGDLTGWQDEWEYVLIDTGGSLWRVNKAAFDRARAGHSIRLRQWVDEWRPA